MKKLFRLLSEPRRKRRASAAVRNQAEFLNAFGGIAQLHRWLKAQPTFRYFPRRFDLFDDIQSGILGNEPIDYLQFGVRYGDSIFRWSTINSRPDSRFIGFDSFEGLPEDWGSVTGVAPKGAFSVRGVVPQTNDGRICFVKGWFYDTLAHFCKNSVLAQDWLSIMTGTYFHPRFLRWLRSTRFCNGVRF
jgi:hypothetical protein